MYYFFFIFLFTNIIYYHLYALCTLKMSFINEKNITDIDILTTLK